MTAPPTLTRLLLLAGLAASCAGMLYARAYVDFERVRIGVVSAALASDQGRLRVPLPATPRLVDTPVAIVLQIENEATTERSLFVDVNGEPVHRGIIGPGRTRVDLSLPTGFAQAGDNVVGLRSDGRSWSLHLLEVGNAYGFSHGMFSLIVVPTPTPPVHTPPGWAAVLAFCALFACSLPLFRRIRHHAWRRLHAAAAGVVILAFVAIALLPLVTQFTVLLSLQALAICAMVLYAPALVAAGRHVHSVVSEQSPRVWASLAGTPIQRWILAAAGWRIRALYLLAVGLFLVSVAGTWDSRTGFTRLIDFGWQFDARAIDVLDTLPHANESEWGYDGQFYAQLALDPLVRDPDIELALDNFSYRARRILFAWTAFGLGLGHPAWVLQAYALQNVLCWLVLALVLVRWFPPVNVRCFVGWFAVLFSYGFIGSVLKALLEGPSLLLLAGAVVAAESGRRWLATGVMGLAGLGRETNVLFAAVLVDRIPRRWRSALLMATEGVAVVLPLVGWWLYLRVTHPHADFQAGGSLNFALPLSAYLEAWGVALASIRADGWASFARFQVLALTSVATQLIFFVVVRRWQSPWYRVGLAYAVLMVVLGPAVWEGTPGAYTRVLLPMTCAYNVLLPRGGRAFWPLVILGNLTVLNAFEALRVPFIWEHL